MTSLLIVCISARIVTHHECVPAALKQGFQHIAEFVASVTGCSRNCLTT